MSCSHSHVDKISRYLFARKRNKMSGLRYLAVTTAKYVTPPQQDLVIASPKRVVC